MPTSNQDSRARRRQKRRAAIKVERWHEKRSAQNAAEAKPKEAAKKTT
ncbi:MAG: hypothetical protein HRU17_14185 [Polyangiaceae bacterium]|nr:hypothetical protein [Polyangiaceae bacterium]